jgi:hypothetical protein
MKKLLEKMGDDFTKVIGFVAILYLFYTFWNIFSASFQWTFGWLFHHPEQPWWIMGLALLIELILLPLLLGGFLMLLIKFLKLIGRIVRSLHN